MHAVDVEALGLGIRLRCVGEQAEQIADLLAKAWIACPTTAEPTLEATVELDQGQPRIGSGEHSIGTNSLEHLIQLVTQYVTRQALRARRGEMLLLHAAGIAHPVTGAAVGLVASSGTGKTTACRRLAGQWSYLTDETLAVRADDSIWPYPKPLSLRAPEAPHKVETAPGELGLTVCPVPATLKGLLVLHRDPGHQGPAVVAALSTLDAICEIAPQSSSLYLLPEPLHLLEALFSRLSTVASVRYSEADSLHDLVAGIIGAAP